MAGGRFGYLIDVASGKATADVKRLSGAIDSQSKGVAALGTAFSGMGRKILGTVAAYVSLSIAYRAFKNLITESIADGRVQLEAEQKLTVKYGDKARALFEMASALQRVTTVGDEVTLQAANQLSYYNLSIDSIRKLAPALIDASQAGMSMTGSAALLGRAMSGNVTMLSRYGIILTDAQKQTMKTGSEMERAGILADAFKSKFGGLAEAMRQTVTGQFIALNNAIGDLKEDLGKAVLESAVLEKAFEGLVEAVTGLTVNRDGVRIFVDEMVKGFLEVAVMATETASPIIKLGKAIKNLVEIGTTLSPIGLLAGKGNAGAYLDHLAEQAAELSDAFDESSADKLIDRMKKLRAEIRLITSGTTTGPGGGLGSIFGDKKSAAAARSATDQAVSQSTERYTAGLMEIQERRFELEQEFWDFSAELSAQHNERMAQEYAQTLGIRREQSRIMAEAAGGYLRAAFDSGTDALGQGIAEAVVDGKKQFDDLAKAFAKTMINQAVTRFAAALLNVIAMALSGGTSGVAAGAAGGAGGAFLSGLLGRHAGQIPSAHGGLFAGPGEHYRKIQDREAIIRGPAVNSETRPVLDAINRTARLPRIGGDSISIVVNNTSNVDADRFLDRLQRMMYERSERGHKLIHARGIANA